MTDAQTPRITVVVPAKDEAVHIRRCVESVRELGRVVVVDAGSADETEALARDAGAEVVVHPWEGYAAQKNWALRELGIDTEWVLFLDADETLTEPGRQEIRAAVAAGAADGYYLPRQYVFLGRPLEHAWWYPDYQLRLFRHGRGRFEERKVHEHVILDGRTATLTTPIVHENVKGLSAFIDRHNRYSDLEADELVAPSAERKRGSLRGSWADRRRLLKDEVWFRLPARPLVRFVWLYVFKRGFRDGRRGRLFCSLIAMYDFLIDAKVLERELSRETREKR